MSQLIVDEVALREPNLLMPGKKPVGPVKIDYSHPIGRSVEGYWLPMPGKRNKYYEGNVNIVAIPESGSPSLVGSSNGLYYTNGVVGETAGQWVVPTPGVTGNGHSLFWCGMFTNGTSSQNQYMINHRHVAGNRLYIYYFSGNNAVTFYHGGGTQYLCGTNVEINKYQSAAMTAVKTSVSNQIGWTRYWNGKEDGVLTSNDLAYMDKIKLSFNLFVDGGTYVVFHFNKELSAAETASLHADPYQFLIPA